MTREEIADVIAPMLADGRTAGLDGVPRVGRQTRKKALAIADAILAALRAEPSAEEVERAAEAVFMADGFVPPCESIVTPFAEQPEVIKAVHRRRALAALRAARSKS